jgi:transcriptional regulator GlxA family with amidase domain
MTIRFITFVCDNVYLASLAALRDVLQIADHVTSRQRRGESLRLPLVESRLLSLNGKPVTTACGIRLPVDGSIDDAAPATVIYLPGMFVGSNADVYLRDHARQVERVVQWLVEQYRGGATLAAVATSNLLLAEAGLLHRMRVPMPWVMESFLHRRYPGITPERHQAIVSAERIWCAGNLSSSLPLAIELLRQYATVSVGSLVAQYIQPEERLPDSAQLMTDSGEDNLLMTRAMALIQRRCTKTIDYAKLASSLAVSQRTLIRHFKKHLGITPQAYQQQLRLDSAKRLLGSTAMPIAEVAGRVGYTNIAYFNRLFLRRVGMSVQTFREQRRRPPMPRTGAS